MKITNEMIEKAKENKACAFGLEWAKEFVDKDISFKTACEASYFLWGYGTLCENALPELKELFEKAIKLNPYPAVKYCSKFLTVENIDFLTKCEDMPNTLLIYAKELMNKEQIKYCEKNVRPKAK